MNADINNERNVIGGDEPGLGNKDEFTLERANFKESRNIQAKVPVGI